jgi:hypothetical protein
MVMSQPLAVVVLMPTFSHMISFEADIMPRFKIITKRDNDKVEIKVDKDQTVFSVHSPSGISQAIIERNDEKWPDAVMLRLHLQGLENLRAANGDVTLDAAVSSHDDDHRIRLSKDGKEGSPLDPTSPYWMEIRMIGGDGKPAKAIPLKDGYFEMTLPRTFFKENPKSITVNWVDFYR